MIAMRFCGQWGNQATQYVVAKILAEKTGLHYEPPPDFYRKDGTQVSWSGEPVFRMQWTKGKMLCDPVRGFQYIDVMHWCDLDAIDASRPVMLSGYFQRYETLRPWKDKIRNEWLRIPEHRFVETDPEAAYVHVRRTDYCQIDDNGTPPDTNRQERATSPEEFARCLQEFPEAKRLVLVTDDPISTAAMPWPLPFTVQSAAWDIDFLTLASARFVVCSCSTFSWWAAWLGKAERIAVPVFPTTYWFNGIGAVGPDRAEFPNLYPTDEAGRWKWLTER